MSERKEEFFSMALLSVYGEEIELRIPYPVTPRQCRVYAALKPLVREGHLHMTFGGYETRPLHRSVEVEDTLLPKVRGEA
jgi:hypothetical protein